MPGPPPADRRPRASARRPCRSSRECPEVSAAEPDRALHISCCGLPRLRDQDTAMPICDECECGGPDGADLVPVRIPFHGGWSRGQPWVGVGGGELLPAWRGLVASNQHETVEKRRPHESVGPVEHDNPCP